MHKKTKLRLSVVAASAAAVLAIGVASPAYADPPSGFRDLVGVGSDTTQDVVNGLASLTALSNVGSYNATGSAQITVRSGGPTFNRPNGSGNGIRALSASINAPGGPVGGRTFPASGGVVVTDQIDFARSSSGPSSSLIGTDLTFIPFGTDVVTYAVSAASDFPRDIALGNSGQDAINPAPFTLRNIYRGAVTTYVDSNFNTVTITPLVPQSGSGTRTFWLSALGLIEGQNVATDRSGAVQEHNGNSLTGAGDIVPFSVAQWIAQGNYASLPTAVTERRGNIELGNIGTVSPLKFATGGGVEANATFPVSRLVFNVIESARLVGGAEAGATGSAALRQAFVGSGSDVCLSASTIRQYGFATIGDLCGNTTDYKQAFQY